MAILAVCPYCGKGKVRAPNGSEGLCATCPSCRNSFTIIVSEQLGKGPSQAGAADETAPAPALEQATAVADVGAGQPAIAPAPPALLTAFPTLPPACPPETRFVTGLALVAISLGGLALAASQLPYGRIFTVALTIFGLFLGLCSLLLAERKPLVPGLAAALNTAGLVIAIFLPGWLGLTSWVPPKTGTDPDTVQAVSLDNSVATNAEEWVDVSRSAWQRDDVRVAVTSIALAPVELTGPNDKKAWTKDRALQVRLQVRNEGVARKIDFRGWDLHPPKDAPAPRLTDSTGKVLAPKTFEAGWKGPGRPQPAALFPGKSAEQLLIFEAPADDPDVLRLELPGSAFGDREPVRLLIRPTSIVHRKGP